MDLVNKILGEFEIHSVEGIKRCFAQGLDPNLIYKGKPLFYELVNMYWRSREFKHCVRTFVDQGLIFNDPGLLAVLLDDDSTLEALIKNDRTILAKQYTLDCTFTPLYQASLLHICAEYNHVQCARVLVNHGLDVNTPAGVDDNGFGGQTSIFHTVNQHDNHCLDMLKFLLDQHAEVLLMVKGLIWGKNYPWETFIPAVNPLSYAMMGLLRQIQRNELQIYEVVRLLMQSAYGLDYWPRNIPNKYLSM